MGATWSWEAPEQGSNSRRLGDPSSHLATLGTSLMQATGAPWVTEGERLGTHLQRSLGHFVIGVAGESQDADVRAALQCVTLASHLTSQSLGVLICKIVPTLTKLL